MKFDSKVIEHINEVSKIDPENAQHMFDLYMKGMAGDSTALAEYVTSGLSGSASASSSSLHCGCSTTDTSDTWEVASASSIDTKLLDLQAEVDTLTSDIKVFEKSLYNTSEKVDRLDSRLSEITDIARALVLLKKDSLESTAALMTVLEGYLDEDIVDEKDIIEQLYKRIKEIKKTPMFKEMKHRIAEYKEERDEG